MLCPTVRGRPVLRLGSWLCQLLYHVKIGKPGRKNLLCLLFRYGKRGCHYDWDKDKDILIRYRLDQARSALKDAAFLREKSDTTAGVVNRAYYAMFYAVLALLQKIEKAPRKHSGAIALFDSEFVRNGIFNKELSAFLHQAFAARQESDYHGIKQVSIENAVAMTQNASFFVQAIEAYLKGAQGGEEINKA